MHVNGSIKMAVKKNNKEKMGVKSAIYIYYIYTSHDRYIYG